jgi:hypothetical protein
MEAPRRGTNNIPTLYDRNASSPAAALPTEDDLSQCVDLLRLLFVASSEPSWPVLRRLAPVVPVLLEMQVAVAAASKVSSASLSWHCCVRVHSVKHT